MSPIFSILFVVAIWWLSTGTVLWLATRAGGHTRLRFLGMVLLGVLGVAGVYLSAHGVTFGVWPALVDTQSYLGFVSALAVWAMVEFTFLTGVLTGPRQKPCPPNVSEEQRFWLAFRTISHHEYALVGALLAIGIMSLPGGHMTAFLTFLMLWLMRISAKLTLFSGAPKFAREMMPDQLKHMESYFRQDRIGPIFWLSTMVLSAAFVAAVYILSNQGVAESKMTGCILLTTLLGLGVLEHWFMVLPIADGRLWRWASPQPKTPKQASPQRKQTHSRDHTHFLVAAGSHTAQRTRRGATL